MTEQEQQPAKGSETTVSVDALRKARNGPSRFSSAVSVLRYLLLVVLIPLIRELPDSLKRLRHKFADISIESVTESARTFTFPDDTPWICAFAAVVLGFFLLRREALRSNSLNKRYAAIFSRLRVKSSRGVRVLLAISTFLSVLAAEAKLDKAFYAVIHATIFVTVLIVIFDFERRSYLLWMAVLGILAVMYNPLKSLGISRDDWIVINWITAMILGAMLILNTDKRSKQMRVK